ncbi:type II toxin-antitoxin system RelE family toxin [Nocardiopsis lambiniae]|uniref:Type II toxin-antitoxin system RelE/ParE family toxin n=1 Tax=Nocardiopsis lambiniae TaxID=3075539 RepID=A0ABU2M5Z9_9ACTN|nr:type II toxin-antitoxin system RelE/ParE family toxin [Nocardiopsis sp. DSM 44743]MDT0328003.1 type II toxin-antitoxin system RelE/ParE family toxin [Nocardiopsis sp. DSM 44743]
MAEITFTDAAVDDLRRLGPDAVPKVLKKVLLLEENPEAGYPLGGGLTGFRKLIVGRNTWRVVYRITDDKSVEVCEVWAVGARADAQVYSEASRRVREASDGSPTARRLAAVLEHLGRGAEPATREPTPRRDPVPDWLAERLIHTVGMLPEKVAALDLEQAVDLWADFRARPH